MLVHFFSIHSVGDFQFKIQGHTFSTFQRIKEEGKLKVYKDWKTIIVAIREAET
jgi:hypothetical protein